MKQFLAGGGWELLPLLTMLFFLGVFALALVRVVRLRGAQAAQLAALPLEEDLPSGRASHSLPLPAHGAPEEVRS